MRSVVSRIALFVALFATAIGTTAALAKERAQPPVDRNGPAGDYPMVLGAPFVVDGVTYTPADTLNYDAVGYAVAGAGEGVSGAQRTLPLPSYVEVTALDSGKTILVRLDRRGPMTGSALIELSPAAWSQLGLAPGAQAPVRVRRVNPIEPERALLRAGQQAPARMDTPPGLLTALKRKLGSAPATTLQPLPKPALPLPQSAPAGPAVVPSTAAHAAPPPARSTPTPSPAASHRPVSTPSPTPASSSTPAPKPAAKPATAKTEQRPAPRGGFVVQVGAFSEKGRAEGVAHSIGGQIAPAGRFWRVRTGPYATQAEADAALAKARRSGYADARIQRTP